jgi:phosphoribosylanthranilate isomerase
MAEEIKKIIHPKFMGVDINSGFEIEPALKNINHIKLFSDEIRS